MPVVEKKAFFVVNVKGAKAGFNIQVVKHRFPVFYLRFESVKVGFFPAVPQYGIVNIHFNFRYAFRVGFDKSNLFAVSVEQGELRCVSVPRTVN